MKVFLIGFMGCGKSTKAKQLAKLLGYPHLDVDHLVEESAGMSIKDYFAEHGEDGFRKLEHQVLQTYEFPDRAIIATGGGLPCFFDNMQWMNTHGKTVYLQMEPKQLVSRLGNREKRPLIKGMDDTQLLKFIEEKLQVRESFYNQASLTVNAFNLDAVDLARELELM